MANLTPLETLIAQFRSSLQQERFVKTSFGNYQGDELELKNIYVRLILVKRVPKLSFTYRFRSRDVVKNFEVEAGIEHASQYLRGGFHLANLFTTANDFSWTVDKNGKEKLSVKAASVTERQSLSHDKEKQRLIKAEGDKAYLRDLRITDATSQVYKNAQDKFKQINHYIELLRASIREVGETNLRSVVDMGSGKGYLTFALYDYLYNVLGLKEVAVTGVEYREDLVALCNRIAVKSGFPSLKFQQGAIIDYEAPDVDMLVALHACDTATDDAIYKGVEGGAKLIVVAPCCHKQIRRQLEVAEVGSEMLPITRFGIFLERQAEMLTDALRALILEYYGYKTKVLEFVSDAHTPKNVLIVATKIGSISPDRQQQIRFQIQQTKAYFGIERHHLEKLFDL
ncbi:SAM-dependent methyltransferase [Olivibacter sp. XZL3]|uniref:class I SAM-dependent methyltransferase n=1 Tax=Olivibacter sp. XZL3 TaxID=1735116 RepID=UPI001065140E|nr:SAM-dependent methyltransferase [Olivibacter sp. XZL3]